MHALVYTQLNTIELRHLPIPEINSDGVLIKTRASGICHTDIEVLKGRYGNATFPLVPGHEYAGEVVAIGSAVKTVSVGDRIVVDPNINCGTCRPCVRGLTNLCETLGAYGVTTNGGFEEFSAVHQHNIIPIGDMPFDEAALAEPMACVLNGVRKVGVEGVENALIFGAGPIGLLMAIAIRIKGVANVTLVDVNPNRLQLARSFGFAAVASGPDELAAFHQNVDLAIDATGIPLVAQGLISYAANGGKVLYFGVCPPEEHIQISPFEIFRRQITIAGAHSLNRNIVEAIETIRTFGPDIRRLVSHHVPLDEIPAFLEGENQAASLKVQAVW